MAELNTQFPAWLAQAHFLKRENNSGERFTQGMQAGAQIAQNNRRLALEERAMLLKEEADFSSKAGLIELGAVVADIAKTGDWTAPENVSRFYSTASKYPNAMRSEAFQNLEQNFVNARKAKETAELWSNRKEIDRDIAYSKIEARFQEQEARINAALQMEGLKSENRDHYLRLQTELNVLRDEFKSDRASDLEKQKQTGRENLRELGHELDVDRDALKPKTRRPEQMDLDESDRMLMKSELDELEGWRKARRSAQFDAEYEKRRSKIEQKYDARKKTSRTESAPAPGATNSPTKVLRYNPGTGTFE
jgi:hypothetical protein